ncbi:YadA-like family protein [uncultured Sphingomonas sp.]|uniref:YadA-like family protein n=1 Tax=uncultured Sphingomonas sp. TaxID=158754 RepID=UPI0025F8D851|nr:YadA-like family protein [uncultured Sphingomonas sp.]
MNALTTTVTAQGVQLTATTNLANSLNTSVNTLNSTVATQASVLQAVQATTNANTSNLATVAASLSQQQAELTANTSLLNVVNSQLGTLGSTVTNQATTLQGLQASVAGNIADVASLSASVNQQGVHLAANANLLGTVSSGLSTLGSTVTDQATALQGLRTTVSGNVADLASLSATVTAQGAQIDANIGAIGTLRDGVGALTGTVTDQGALLQTVQGSVGTLTSTVGTLASDVAAAGTQIARQTTDISALQATVGANVTDLAQVRATLGATGTDVTNLQTQVAAHETRISANTAQLGTLGTTVSAQGTTLTQQGNDLATAAANIASLQGLVTTQGGTLGALGTTVAAQATLLGQQDARITANADAILSLRNMSVSGNPGPLQFIDPSAPTVVATTATNDVALFGAQSGPVRVHNVGDGEVKAGSTDAVNGGQLYDVGQQVNGLAAVAVRYDDPTRARITLGGANAAPVVLANVAPGSIAAASTEAVNGGQLFDTNNAVAALRSDVTNQANDLSNAQTSLAALGTTVTAQGAQISANVGAIGTLRGDVERGAVGPVRYSDPATPNLPNGGTITQSVALVGRDPAPVELHNVADGTVGSGSNDAVNGGQLFALAQSYQGLSDLAVRYDDAAQTSMTLGMSGVPVALRNVAAGTLAAGSSDAATAGQLFETNQSVGTLTNLATLQSGLLSALDERVGGLRQDFGKLDADIAAGTRGPIRYSDTANPTNPGGGNLSQDLTLVGAESGPVRLHNVGDGVIAAGSFDAVNGGQIFSFGTNVASALGNGFRYDPLTGFSGNFTFKGQSFGSVQSVIGAIELSLTSPPAGGISDTGMGIKYFRANSMLIDSNASGADATAIGPASTSSGVAAVAVGRNSVAAGESSVAIGDGAQAKDGKAVAIGLGNVASGDGAVAIGDPNFATGAGATALGKDNSATGLGAIALGHVNIADGDGSSAVGTMNRSSGLGATALGFTNVADGRGAIAIGTNNTAIGDGALAIGSNVVTNSADTLAIGNSTVAKGVRAIAIGNKAIAAATYAAAFGYDAEARADYSTAIGTAAEASGLGTTVIGTSASASGYAASAFGSGAVADKDGSVALGSASQTTRGAVDSYSAFGVADPQQSAGEIAIARNIAFIDPVTNRETPVGNRQITGVSAGWSDYDAVNVMQLRGISGTLGAAFAAGFGGGASYDRLTGTLSGPSYTINGVTYSSVGDALQAIDARVGSGTTTPPTTTPTPPGNQGNAIDTRVSAVETRVDSVESRTGSVETRVNSVENRVGSVETRVGSVENQVTSVATRVGTVENRVTSVEDKADKALAASEQSIKYDDTTRTSATLGDGKTAVSLHNVAAGTSDGDAVNLAQLNNATSAAVDAANSYTDQRVAALSFDLNRVNRDLNAGVAGALAMAGMPQPFEEGKSMFAMGAGTFQGQSAAAVGMSHIMDDGHVVFKLGATYNSRKRVGANIGVGYQF